jgi:chromosome segregation ATPase
MSNGTPEQPSQPQQLAIPLMSTNALATIATIVVAVGGAFIKQQQDHASTSQDLSTNKTEIASVQNDINDLSALKSEVGELKSHQADQSKSLNDSVESIHSLQASVNRLERLLLTPRKSAQTPSPSP